MLDKSVPYYDFMMVRPGDAPAFRAGVPAGYALAFWRPGDEADWARIEASVGEFATEAEALAYFKREFLPHAELLAGRCLFAVNPAGEKVGTLTAWHDREDAPMIHWVAVCPREQGRGLAKALLARGLGILGESYPGKAVTLHTQTWSHVAVRLYESAAFSIECGDTPQARLAYTRAAYILRCLREGGGKVSTEELLNQPEAGDRLKALAGLSRDALPPLSGIYVNNHIHTIYSFSPYSPALALYRARMAGLPTAGIMDHDSVAGAAEFAEAGRLLGVATTAGLECRVSTAHTPLGDRRTNNPDQSGVTYLAMHGIPAGSLEAVDAFLKPVRAARDIRNREMTLRLSAALEPAGVSIDYERDVRPLSQWEKGGTVTERHLCMAAASALCDRYGTGETLVAALGALGIAPPPKIAALLRDGANPYLKYDLLGLLKSDLVQRFYVPATDECPPIGDFVALCKEAGGIAVYPYLGDVGDSVTGDKKAQRFEDGYLDELFRYLEGAGFDAVAYMPTRNTPAQLARVQALCARHNFFQISGEDINSPRQSFICPQLEQPEFAHLREATWALIGHEREASRDVGRGMFSDWAKRTHPGLRERVAYYARVGKADVIAQSD